MTVVSANDTFTYKGPRGDETRAADAVASVLYSNNGSPLVMSATTAIVNQVSLSTTAALVLASNTSRIFAKVKNTDGTIVIYLGKDSSVTALNGMPLIAGAEMNFEGYTGDIYAIAASATPKAAYFAW